MSSETERTVDCAAALVTACLEDTPSREVINELLYEAHEGGWLFDLTAALAFGFAANVEGIGAMTEQDPRELWSRWCLQEAEQRTTGRPFRRPEGS